MPAGAVKFGIKTQPQFTTVEDVVAIWQEADRLGFDTAWLQDHLMPLNASPSGPSLEGWTLLAYLAGQTKRIRIGLMVASTTYHHPVLLAKMGVNIDILSGGRFEAGFGSGSGFSANEHKQYGIPWPPFTERVERFEEALRLIKRLWTESRIDFNGKYYQVSDAPFEPKPLQQPYPPIMIGGMSDRTLDVIAREANGWNMPALTESKMVDRMSRLKAACAAVGRDVNSIDRSVQIIVDGGNLPAVFEQARRCADLGFNHLILMLKPPFDPQLVRKIADELVPSVAGTPLQIA